MASTARKKRWRKRKFLLAESPLAAEAGRTVSIDFPFRTSIGMVGNRFSTELILSFIESVFYDVLS